MPDTRPSPEPMPRCACPDRDAARCLAIREQRQPPAVADDWGYDADFCDCVCHDTDPDRDGEDATTNGEHVEVHAFAPDGGSESDFAARFACLVCGLGARASCYGGGDTDCDDADAGSDDGPPMVFTCDDPGATERPVTTAGGLVIGWDSEPAAAECRLCTASPDDTDPAHIGEDGFCDDCRANGEDDYVDDGDDWTDFDGIPGDD